MGACVLQNCRQLLTIGALFLVVAASGCDVLFPSEPSFGWPPCPDADTLVIDTRVVWRPQDSPIMLADDVRVTRQGRLEIRPGTEVHFVDDSVVECDPAGDMLRRPHVSVRGELVCVGRPDSLVTFVGSELWEAGGDLEIRAPEGGAPVVSIRWTSGLGYAELGHGSPHLAHCEIEQLDLYRCVDAEIESCSIGGLFAEGGDGLIAHCDFSTTGIFAGLSLHSDSLHVDHNVFRDIPGDLWGAITCGNGSRALITNNVIEDCGVGILAFDASPEAHGNNLVGNGVALALMPWSQHALSDTLDFTENWWGTVSLPEIQQQVEYWENGDLVSRQTVLLVPFAEGPYDLP